VLPDGPSLHRRLMHAVARCEQAQDESRVAIDTCTAAIAAARTTMSETRRARDERLDVRNRTGSAQDGFRSG
jgi:hypothetical protein